MPLSRTPRGFTLLELVVAMGATLVVTALVVQAIIALDAEQAVRKNVAELQSSTRIALDTIEADLRHASLGAGTGVIWQASGSNRVSRPAVQVFTAVPGGTGGAIDDAKPGTDAVLVVEAIPQADPAATGARTGRTVTTSGLTTSVGAFAVSSAANFASGDPVLLGDYGEAAWGTLSSANGSTTPQTITLAGSVNVLPGRTVPQLGTGAPVRRARARLYYVNTADELVRLTLAVPRAPTASDIGLREVLAGGIENMQVDCQLWDGGTDVVACSDASNPAPVVASGDPVADEATATFGSFGSGGGARITTGNVSRLRAVVVSVAARSRLALVGAPGRTSASSAGMGDPPIALTGASGVATTLGPGSASGASATAAFARRSYRLAAGVRNTSLESL
jgi:hypothetical protein